MGSGHTTPTAARTPQQAQPPAKEALPRLSSTNLARTTVHDTAVDVVIAPFAGEPGNQVFERKSAYKSAMQASCIITIWSIDETQYYTLTFTSATTAEPVSKTQTSSRIVNRTNTGAHLNKSRSSGSSSSSGRRSGSSSNPSSKVATPILQHPEFPPRGPPIKSRGDIAISASIFQKATQLKDAILNSINMPAYGALYFVYDGHTKFVLTYRSNVERRGIWNPE